MFTGSPALGRQIAQVAGGTLVPMTLELGGKCPAIVTEDAVDHKSVSHILGIKTIKNGQMCNTVDYCLVPRGQVQEFVDIAKAHVSASMPAYSTTDDCTGIITERHLDRLIEIHAEAVATGFLRTSTSTRWPVSGPGLRTPASVMSPARSRAN